MSKGDPRLAHLPFMGGPIPILSVVCVYVYLVKYAGPRFMANREPFEIKSLILTYNFLMVLLSTYLFIRGGVYGWFGDYSFKCEPLDYTNSRNGVGMAYTAYIYFLSKIVELSDTVFFVLRKKFDHISSLHVTHHATLAWTMYWGVKYYPTGHGSFGPFFNTFVHIIMYSYYFLAALGPSVQPYLWWKKYLTQLQLVQFVIIFLHASQVFLRPDCSFPKGVMLPFLAVVIYFIVMFVDFYQTEYIKKKQKLRTEGSRKRESVVSEQKKVSTSTDPNTVDAYYYYIRKRNASSSNLVQITSRMRPDLDRTSSRHLNGTGTNIQRNHSHRHHLGDHHHTDDSSDTELDHYQ